MREVDAIFEDEKLELLVQYLKETTGRLKELEKKLKTQSKRISELEKREASIIPEDTRRSMYAIEPTSSPLEEIMRAKKAEEMMRMASAPIPKTTEITGGMYAR